MVNYLDIGVKNLAVDNTEKTDQAWIEYKMADIPTLSH